MLLLAGFDSGPRPGQVLDEARAAGRDAASFPAAGEDYFHDMDGGVALTPDEIKGRNTWLLWTGGNDRFWDGMTASTFGAFDLLKIVAYDPTKKADRDWRWSYLGLINEPCFEAPSEPDPDRFGLMLDMRRSDCPADPFANESKYPGVKIGARGQDGPGGLAITVFRPASSGCGCSRIPISTRPRRSAGTLSAISPIRPITMTRIWSVPIGSGCPAGSAMSARARPIRRRTRPARNGQI